MDDERDEDDETFGTIVLHRDYKALADQLEVFCVSSRAFQKLQGRSGDDKVAGFEELEDTQIPQLQQHAIAVTEDSRLHHNRAFLSQKVGALNTITLWASSNGMGFALAMQKKRKKDVNLPSILDPFEKVSRLHVFGQVLLILDLILTFGFLDGRLC